MPKEIIFGRDDDWDRAVFVPTVKWNRAGWAQLGIHYSDDPDSMADSCWADLNRKQINNLIRVLRKARDQAYGADE